MKKGFTLAETLVTLGIVGIIVAITIPGFMKIRPDKMKIQYLKAYDALEQAVKDLANNTRLYPLAGTIINNGTDNYDFSKYPLANIYNNVEKVESKILNGSTTITKTSELPNELKNAKGNTKFCKALAWELGENGENCKDDGETKNSFTDPSFTTKNGMVWVVTQDIDLQDTAVTSQESSFATTVQVDVNGAEGPNAFYSANTQPNPDRFTFLVQADGIVTPADPMGQTYLDSRKAFLSKNVSSEASQKTTYTWWDKTKAKTDYDKDPEFVLEKIINTASINNGGVPEDPINPEVPGEPVGPSEPEGSNPSCKITIASHAETYYKGEVDRFGYNTKIIFTTSVDTTQGFYQGLIEVYVGKIKIGTVEIAQFENRVKNYTYYFDKPKDENGNYLDPTGFLTEHITKQNPKNCEIIIANRH